jgi:hypothetical protein
VQGNLYGINMVVSYNGGNFMDLIKQQSNFNLSSNYSKIGLTVAYAKGMLEVFGVFI